MNETLENVVKYSFVYGSLFSQPFATIAGAYPIQQNKMLLEKGHLQYGEHSEIVQVLQNKLSQLSYYDDHLDGDYGIFTEYAIKKFQQDYNIKITGQADAQTIFSLIEEEKKQYLKKIEQISERVYIGMQSEDVKIIQEALQYFGYYDGELDGIYGPLTESAIKTVEENYNLQLMNEQPQQPLATIYEQSTTEAKEIVKTVEEGHNVEQIDREQSVPQQVHVEEPIQSDVIEVAQSLIGTPYVWGGTSPNGFDCSGFIQFVYQTDDVFLPRTVNEIWNFSTPIDSPSIGDLVFFETYQPGPSHAGIYLGNNQFIHAGSNGVEISNITNDYWQSRYLGAKRIQ